MRGSVSAPVGVAVLFVALSCTVIGVDAWWDYPHLLVCEIARRNIRAELRPQIDDLLALERSAYPELSTLPAVAVWADFIKEDISAFSHYHVTSKPYNPTHMDLTAHPAASLPRDDIITGLTAFYSTLTSPILMAPASEEADSSAAATATAASDAASPPTPPAYTLNGAWAKQFALRMTVHLMGDLHQPLHTSRWWDATRFAASGDNDENGFEYRIHHIADAPTPPTVFRSKSVTFDSLHRFFDSAAGLYTARLPLPPTAEAIAAVETEADELMKVHTLEMFSERFKKETIYDFDAFATEGHELAVKWAYHSTEIDTSAVNHNHPTEPTAAYINELQPILQKQIVLAGYRLARVLNASDFDVTKTLQSAIAATTPPPPPLPTGTWSASAVAVVMVLFIVAAALPVATYYCGRRHGTDAASFDPPSALDDAASHQIDMELYAQNPKKARKPGGSGGGSRGSTGALEADDLLQLN